MKGKHETIELASGELLHLRRDPDGRWFVTLYEWGHRFVSKLSGMYFENGEIRARWKDRPFSYAKSAIAVVEEEIRLGLIPSNRR